jgi:beta-phosphoglucomutase-like phosphatase (HAD superfamily)
VTGPVAAIILDFDGLILDTETPIFEAWREAYRGRGQVLSMDDWQHSLGTNGGFDPLARLVELAGEGLDREAVEREVREANRQGCDAQALLPGVEALLVEAESLGLRRAVATSSSRAWVEGWLTRHGIRGRVEVICARDDVARVKPAPDLFLLAAERLAVPPAACLVFEDSPNGMRAARTAGMRCVAVPNGLTRQLRLPDPDLVLGSLAERPLGAILEELCASPRSSS